MYHRDSIDEDGTLVIGSGNLDFDLSGRPSPGGVAVFAIPSECGSPIDCVAINAYKINAYKKEPRHPRLGFYRAACVSPVK